MLSPRQRQRFDEQLEIVLAELPVAATKILDDVPLIVDDAPSPELMREMDVEFPDELCGLHSGVPLTEPGAREFRQSPDQIHIFRLGVLASAEDEHGRITKSELRRQIRITILHEVGHHYGLSEDELRELGYD